MNARERQLFRGHDLVRMEPKSFDLLHYLLIHAGNLVSKQELVENVWTGAVVTDNSLTRCIHQVRTALEDNADSPTFVETVAGSGYRFIAPVMLEEESVRDTAASRLTRLQLRRPMLLVPLALAAITGLAWIVFVANDSPVSKIERIAVLPLTNLTGSPEQEYFVQGIHEALITEISRIELIEVISRTSVMRYQDTTLSIPEIATQLEVDAIVEGSVSRSDDQLTVTTQLIAASPERHIWARRFHRSVGDIFEITTEVARSIANEMSIEISPAEKSVLSTTRPVDPNAYDAYLLGRFHVRRRNQEGYDEALKLFQRAIEIDPEFAPSYTKLAETFGSSAIFGMRSPADSMPKARVLAEKAIVLDSTYFHAHMALAAVSFYWDWDWIAAERGARRALALNPNASTSYRFLSEVLSVTGRHEEALAAIERGRKLDPFHPISQFKPSLILYLMRDYDEAIARAETGLALFPEFWQGHWLLCMSLSPLERHEEAIDACSASVAFSNRTPQALGALGYANAIGGRTDAARQILRELQELRLRRYVGAANFAIIYGALHELDHALDELERAYEEHDILLVHVENYSFFDPLRQDERFSLLQGKAMQQKIAK